MGENLSTIVIVLGSDDEGLYIFTLQSFSAQPEKEILSSGIKFLFLHKNQFYFYFLGAAFTFDKRQMLYLSLSV